MHILSYMTLLNRTWYIPWKSLSFLQNRCWTRGTW